jgi:hypothetical protein
MGYVFDKIIYLYFLTSDHYYWYKGKKKKAFLYLLKDLPKITKLSNNIA